MKRQEHKAVYWKTTKTSKTVVSLSIKAVTMSNFHLMIFVAKPIHNEDITALPIEHLK